MDRIVALLDMDCFYVQVEQRENPETKGKPCAVIQYKGRGIIAVSYEARSFGIKRGMRGDMALSLCPELVLFTIPEKRGKAELKKYRTACSEIIQCILQFCKEVERASIDEAYIDLTDMIDNAMKTEDLNLFMPMDPNPESFVLQADLMNSTIPKIDCHPLNQSDWYNFVSSQFTDGRRLALASALIYKIRQLIFSQTGFKCSAGIATNKTLAKLACSLNKPNKQTVVPLESISTLLGSTPIRKIRNLGGKFGLAVMERFKVETLGQLVHIPLSSLEKEFGEKGAIWLYDLCRGRDSETVTTRFMPQSVSCSKNFPGRDMLTSSKLICHWLKCLAEELVERLLQDHQEHCRMASRLTLLFCSTADSKPLSRVLPQSLLQPIWIETSDCNSIEQNVSDQISRAGFNIIRGVVYKEEPPEIWDFGITHLGLCAGKFVYEQSNLCADIRSMFQKMPTSKIHQKTQLEYCHATESEPRFDLVEEQVSVPSCSAENISIDPKSSASSSSSSFFKRLRVAEVSNLGSSHPSTETPPTNTMTDVSPQSPHKIQAHPTNQELMKSLPELDLDNDSRSSSTSDTTGFFLAYSAGDWIVCDQCGSRVSVWQLPEHSDFHFAQRLQQEWSDKPNVQTKAVTPSSNPVPKPAQKNLRGGGHANKRKPVVDKVSTLDKFVLKLPKTAMKPK